MIVCDISFSFYKADKSLFRSRKVLAVSLEKRGYFQVGNPLRAGLSAPANRSALRERHKAYEECKVIRVKSNEARRGM